MTIESHADVEALRRVGRIVAVVLDEMLAALEPGMTTAELDAVGARALARHGARSAPQLTYDFPAATCISVNEEAAHGVPGARVIARRRRRQRRRLRRARRLLRRHRRHPRRPADDAGEDAPLLGHARAPSPRPWTAPAPARRWAASAPPSSDGARRIGCRSSRTSAATASAAPCTRRPSPSPASDDPRERRVLREGMVITIEPFLSTRSRAVVEAADGWTLVTAPGNLVGAVRAHDDHHPRRADRRDDRLSISGGALQRRPGVDRMPGAARGGSLKPRAPS